MTLSHKLHCLIALLFLSFSSTNGIKDYYFSVQEYMLTPKIYQYENKDASNEVLYWHISSSQLSNETFMTTQVYDEHFEPVEIIKERITTKGSELVGYTSFVEGKPIEASIFENKVFSWDQKKGESIHWSLQSVLGYRRVNIEKKRTYHDANIQRTYALDIYHTVKFKDEYHIEFLSGDQSEKITYYQFSYYAKGLGLLEYVRHLPDGRKGHYALKAILSEADWNQLKQ